MRKDTQVSDISTVYIFFILRGWPNSPDLPGGLPDEEPRDKSKGNCSQMHRWRGGDTRRWAVNNMNKNMIVTPFSLPLKLAPPSHIYLAAGTSGSWVDPWPPRTYGPSSTWPGPTWSGRARLVQAPTWYPLKCLMTPPSSTISGISKLQQKTGCSSLDQCKLTRMWCSCPLYPGTFSRSQK